MKHFLITALTLFSLTANACGLATPIKISGDYQFSDVKIYPPLDRVLPPPYFDADSALRLEIIEDGTHVMAAYLVQGGIFGSTGLLNPERVRREIVRTPFGQTHITKIMNSENTFAEGVSTIIEENGYIVSIKIEENKEIYSLRFHEMEMVNRSTCVTSVTLK